RATVGAELRLVTTAQARAADVIADRRAAQGDGAGENLDDRLAQALGLAARDLAPQKTRMQPRLEKCLVGVDVADAGDEPLVEQARLEIAAGLAQAVLPRGRVESERFGAEPVRLEESIERGSIVEERDAAEAAHVTKAELFIAREAKDEVGV